jgi:2-C-methyl-D-erythritol 4-phosphate cytidylyltransferase
VVSEVDRDYCKAEVLVPYGFTDRVILVSGGVRRQDSVYNALNHISAEDKDIIVIHDGVRPFVTKEQIIKTIDKALLYGSCILAISAFDTIKKIKNDYFIEKTIDRKNLYLAQTPQTFQYHIIKHAHEEARRIGFIGTDDASLLEWLGFNVKIAKGSQLNIKITTPEDLILADSIFLFYKK